MFLAEASSRPTSSGLRTTGRRRGSRVETSSSARSRRFSVTPEEEPQRRGTDVDGRYRRPDRRQPQLIATDILGGGLVGRPAQKIGKPFDVADIVELRLGAKLPDCHVVDQAPA